MGKRIYMSWQAKESNNDKRVNLYSKPGVSEVIYANEWKNGRRRTNNDNIGSGRRRPASELYGGTNTGNIGAFIFIIIIAVLAYLVFYPSTPSTPSTPLTPSNIDIPVSEISPTSNPTLIQNKPSIDIGELESKIHVLINENRKNNGVSSLSLDDKLASVARVHSVDMSINNYFEHDNKKGEDPTMRGQNMGYTCRKDYGSYYTNGIAENIFQNNLYDSTSYVNGIPVSHDWNSLEEIAQSTVNGWMNSPGHRQNILKEQYDKEGIGVAISSDDKVLITEDFC